MKGRSSRAVLWTLALFTLALAFSGCGSGEGSVDGGTDGGKPPTGCGNGKCEAGENCLTCPEDCPCACGDGLCTYGEFCANCPKDCDCTTLAATPPMGWNSWNKFNCNIDETLIRGIADTMVSTGMRDAGYVYLNLDDCWQESRALDGTIVADPVRFPSGIPALADYVHSKGLKFGLYTCAGTMTCQKKPGSYLHEAQDAMTYASWNVDYIKVDWCFTEGMDPVERYTVMHDGLAAAGRPIVFSLCDWGVDAPWVWGPRTGQLWRTTGDIADFFTSVLMNFETTSKLAAFASPGHWNDPDMLEVGNGGMTEDEYRAHMSLWALIASPLIAGNDIRTMTQQTKDMLLNPEVIAVNQDPAGLQGVKVAEDAEGQQVWARPVTKKGARAVVMFNRTGTNKEYSVRWSDLGLAPGKAAVRDLWQRKDLGEFQDSYKARVKSFGVVMLLVTGVERVPQAGETYLSAIPWMHAANGLGPVEKDKSNGGDSDGDGGPIKINGKTYEKGLGTFGGAIILYNLGRRCTSFSSDVGVDDAASGKGSEIFEVWADGAKLFESGVMTGGMAAKQVAVDLTGKRELKLVVKPGANTLEGGFADWAGAKITCK
jgi:alpha-galactosidase